MSLEEFYKTNKPFYIDRNTGLIKFPASKYYDKSHAEWFTDVGYQWHDVTRGRVFLNSDKGDHILLYVNNFNIPAISIEILPYLFEHFPTVKWIGLGCYIGKKGDEWEPQITVYSNAK